MIMLEAIAIILGCQWAVLFIWAGIAKVEEEDEYLPTFKQALLLMFIPMSFAYILLSYLKKNDKERDK